MINRRGPLQCIGAGAASLSLPGVLAQARKGYLSSLQVVIPAKAGIQ